MDFEIAARRLQQDQKSALARSRASRHARTASAKSKKEAQLARAKAERRLKEKKLESERNARIVDRIVRDVGRVERYLGVANVSPGKATVPAVAVATDKQSSLFANNIPLASGWTFTTATSIHGEGDKIALPPSILETITSSSNDLDPWGSGRNGRPIAFRIGILNPEYSFPSSDKMKALMENVTQQIISSEKNALSHQSSSMTEDFSNVSTNEGMDDSDDESDDSPIIEAYLDELSHRYLSYTHGTVVEFTQENECVGLPESIARALIQPNSHSLVGNALVGRQNDIPVRRTVDPASSAMANDNSKDANEANGDMDIDTHDNSAEEGSVSEKTPGHPAYGIFDVPALPIEITPINSLPPGKNCTFTPTASSVENGFYSLKDVKLVLEQSLMRTRATLSKGDVIRTWRRGVSFDLIVSSLSPAEYGAVSCVNTDLNVDIGPAEGEVDEAMAKYADHSSNGDKPEPKSMGSGRLLSEPSSQTKSKESASSAIAPIKTTELRPEPAENVTEGVCNIQIRGRTPSGSAAGRRRFDISTATMGDLFAFASQVCDELAPSSFRLVARFPRRVFGISSEGGNYGCFAADATLESAGIGQGQELFMVESV
mmetsp:Transcript_19576/g.42525  ORF Transcript_19576/g.42525 Transcript_19576/m.42525 type:complete len:603 (-) Transcript_19576:45-1853(-)